MEWAERQGQFPTVTRGGVCAFRYILPLSGRVRRLREPVPPPCPPPLLPKEKPPPPAPKVDTLVRKEEGGNMATEPSTQTSHIRLISYIAMSASQHMLPSSALGPPPAPRANEHVGEGFSTPGGLGTVAVRPSCFCPKEKVASSSAAEGTSSAGQNGF